MSILADHSIHRLCAQRFTAAWTDQLSPQSALFHPVDVPLMPIETLTQQNVVSSRTDRRPTSIEVSWPSLLEVSEKAWDLHVDRLVTTMITPSDQYIQTVIQKPEVKEAIRRFRLRAKLYMVTGARVAEDVRHVGLGAALLDSSALVMVCRVHEIAFSAKFGRFLVRDEKFDNPNGPQLHDTIDSRAYSSVVDRDSSPVSEGEAS
ncbi:hypothetical protein V8E54_001060 [Elaphomyces granulatus]